MAKADSEYSLEDYEPVGRQVPYDVEAELSLIGSLILERDTIVKVAPMLKAEDFYRERNRWVYEAVLSLYERREPPDLRTVSAELERRGKLKDVGQAYITGAMNSVPTAYHAEYYAGIVKRTAVLRRLISAGGEIAALGFETEQPVEDVLSKAQIKLTSVLQSTGGKGYTWLHDMAPDFLERMEAAMSRPNKPRGVPTGLPDLDSMTGGLQKSDVIVLAAPSGAGKSSLALNVAYHAAREGHVVGINSLEMNKDQLLDRLVSLETGVDSQALRLGKYLSDDEHMRIQDAIGRIARLPIAINDDAAIRVGELRAKALQWKAEFGLDLLVVDYLQLMKGRQSRYGSETAEVTEISHEMKQLARDLDIPVIEVAQLSRDIFKRANHTPMLSDLRLSGAIEQDADVVIFIDDKRVFDSEVSRPAAWIDLIIAKQRNGAPGKLQVWFDPVCTRFISRARRAD